MEERDEIILKLHSLIDSINEITIRIDDMKVERDLLVKEFKELEIVGKQFGII